MKKSVFFFYLLPTLLLASNGLAMNLKEVKKMSSQDKKKIQGESLRKYFFDSSSTKDMEKLFKSSEDYRHELFFEKPDRVSITSVEKLNEIADSELFKDKKIETREGYYGQMDRRHVQPKCFTLHETYCESPHKKGIQFIVDTSNNIKLQKKSDKNGQSDDDNGVTITKNKYLATKFSIGCIDRKYFILLKRRHSAFLTASIERDKQEKGLSNKYSWSFRPRIFNFKQIAFCLGLREQLSKVNKKVNTKDKQSVNIGSHEHANTVFRTLPLEIRNQLVNMGWVKRPFIQGTKDFVKTHPILTTLGTTVGTLSSYGGYYALKKFLQKQAKKSV